jgi:DNA-binding transcriptional LysR family regulator
MTIESRHMRYVLAVAEHRSFGRALAGPSLPQHVQRALAAALHPGERVRAALVAPALAVECDSHTMLKDVLRASDALSFMPRCMVQPEVAAGLLQVLPGVDLGVVVRFGVGWLREHRLSAAGRRFVELLREHDAALAASQPGAPADAPARRRTRHAARAAG